MSNLYLITCLKSPYPNIEEDIYVIDSSMTQAIEKVLKNGKLKDAQKFDKCLSAKLLASTEQENTLKRLMI